MSSDYYDDDDFDIDLDDPNFTDEDTGYSSRRYEVWLIGYDNTGHETDYSFRVSVHTSERAANIAIDDLCDEDPYDLRDAYSIPDDVAELEIRGIHATDDSDIFAESELFRTQPIMM